MRRDCDERRDLARWSCCCFGGSGVCNPIRLARAVLEHCPHMMLVAEGAERFARDNGMALCDPADLVSDAERHAWRVCSQDKTRGGGIIGGTSKARLAPWLSMLMANLFAATSTGGTCCKLPGRVGDSPLIGCGCYADSTAGGAFPAPVTAKRS